MEYYSIAQVAEMSCQSQKTIRRHIAAGKLIAEKHSNKYRISSECYEAWLRSDSDPEANNIFKEAVVNTYNTDDV